MCTLILFMSVFIITYFNMEAITPKFIKDTINEILGIDIGKKTRLRSYSDARSIYYVLCRKYTTYSLDEIGKQVNRHHASVLHGINNVFPVINKVLYTILNSRFKEIIKKQYTYEEL